MKIWIESIIIAIVATAVSYLIGHSMGWITSLDWLEVSAVFTSFICTYMCVKETRWNYPIGVVTTLFYSVLFYKMEMYAVAAFNLYLVFSLTYGWFRWGPDGNPRPVTTIQGIWWLGYIAIGLAVWCLLEIVNASFGVEISNVEIIITVMSGVAQFMLDNKKIETWFFWIIVNVFSIIFFFYGGLYLVALQYVFFLVNAFYGLYCWYDSLLEERDAKFVKSGRMAFR